MSASTVVRWKEGRRWFYGRWSGQVGSDGSLTVAQAPSEAAARLDVRATRMRALRPERVEFSGTGPRGGVQWNAVLVGTVSPDDLTDAVITPSSDRGNEPAPADDTHCAVAGDAGGSEPAAPPPGAGDEEATSALALCDDSSASLVLVTSREGVDPLLHVLRELCAYASVLTWSGFVWSPANRASGSSLVAALERVYRAVRRDFPELPDAVIITGSGADGYGLRWGHFAHDRWQDDVANGRRPELFVGGERLATGAELTVQTLLHECAHALAVVRGIQDTSRGFRYHNREFVKLANLLDLAYEHERPDSSIGWSAVTLTDVGRKRWHDEITQLADALTLHLDDPTSLLTGPGGAGGRGGHGVAIRRRKGTGGTSYLRAECMCSPPRIIRVSASTLAAAPIICSVCMEEFTS